MRKGPAQNSEKPRKARKKGGPGRPYPKGRSGNPGGRPRSREADAIIRELFKEKGEGVVKKLYLLCTDKDKRLRLQAIREVLDRVMGRPVQAMDVKNTEIPPTEEQLVGELRKKLVERNPELVEQLAAALGDSDA